MQIFVTNMKTSPDRRSHMEKQLKGTKLIYEFFDCVVGADLTEEDISKQCDVESIKKQNERVVWFSRGVIGCTMTNQNMYREMVKRNLDYIMILEDDTLIPADLHEKLEFLEGKIIQGDVILLYWNCWEPVRLTQPVIKTPFHFNIYDPINKDLLTTGSACIVSRKAAEKMLVLNTPIHTTPDNWAYFQKEKCIDRLLIAYPQIVQTADFKSTMKSGKYLWAREIINKYKLFPFYQYLKYKRNKYKKRLQKVVFE